MANEIDDLCQRLSLDGDGDGENLVLIQKVWVDEATNAGKN